MQTVLHTRLNTRWKIKSLLLMVSLVLSTWLHVFVCADVPQSTHTHTPLQPTRCIRQRHHYIRIKIQAMQKPFSLLFAHVSPFAIVCRRHRHHQPHLTSNCPRLPLFLIPYAEYPCEASETKIFHEIFHYIHSIYRQLDCCRTEKFHQKFRVHSATFPPLPFSHSFRFLPQFLFYFIAMTTLAVAAATIMPHAAMRSNGAQERRRLLCI